MTGNAAYDDYAVKHAMSVWKDLVDKGYFTNNSNADSWTDASDKVARGKAAMTLMGTWITMATYIYVCGYLPRLILGVHLPTYREGRMAKQNATYLPIWKAFSPATDPLPGKEPRTSAMRDHTGSCYRSTEFRSSG